MDSEEYEKFVIFTVRTSVVYIPPSGGISRLGTLRNS